MELGFMWGASLYRSSLQKSNYVERFHFSEEIGNNVGKINR